MKPPFEEKSSSEQLTRKEGFELKNKQGELLGRVEIEYREGEFRGRPREQIIKFILFSPNGRVVDLFDFVGLSCPVYITEWEHCGFDPVFGVALVPRPESPKHLAAALHEFGHVIQHEQKQFQILYEMAKPRVGHSSINLPYWSEIREKMLLIQQELHVVLDPEIMDKIDKAYKTCLDLNSDERERVSIKVKELEGVFYALTEKYADELQKILIRPRNILEIDATRRAVKWMRKLAQEFGINLVKDTESFKELEKGLSTYSGRRVMPEKG